MIRKLRIVGAALVLSLVYAPAWADTIALAPTGVSDVTDSREYTIGWAFTLTSGVTVTDLGYWDTGLDGLSSSHEVGIYTSGGTLLTSTVVPSGTSGTLDGGYRFQSIAPFVLGLGSYVIGGASIGSFDEIIVDVTSITTIPGLTVTSADVFTFGGALAFPTSHSGLDYYSPNFRVEAAQETVVPEPATLLLLGSGVLAAALRRRRPHGE